MKHMQLRFMFVKELVKSGAIQLQKVCSKENPADMLTKPLDPEAMRRCMQIAGCWKLEELQQPTRREEVQREPGEALVCTVEREEEDEREEQENYVLVGLFTLAVVGGCQVCRWTYQSLQSMAKTCYQWLWPRDPMQEMQRDILERRQRGQRHVR